MGGLSVPTYEYQCRNEHCENHEKPFEEIQRITDEPLKDCPICATRVQRLISSTSFKFKGGAPTPKHYV